MVRSGQSAQHRVVPLGIVAVLFVTAFGLGLGDASASVSAAPTVQLDCKVPVQSGVPRAVDQTSYEPITPRRIVDTRSGDGGHRGIIPGDCALRVQLDDAFPAGGTAVALSVTAVAPGRGFMTVFPCASGRPLTSNLNTRHDSPTPALVVVAPDATGTVCIYSKLDSHVVVDVQGAFTNGDGVFTPVTPVRAYDTRELPGRPPLPAGAIRNVPLAGKFVPASATAVVANLTVTETAAPGWVVAYPCGVDPPLASNGNYLEDESRAVAIIVGLGRGGGGDGQICVKTKATTHFIIDVVGYYSPPPPFGPGSSVRSSVRRLADTRTSSGLWTTPFRAGETRRLDPLAGHPDRAWATSVTLNAIGLNAQALGFLAFYPCTDASGVSRPTVSSLNTAPQREVANLVTVELSSTESVCVFSKSAGDVVIDLVAVGTVDEGSPLRQIDLGDIEVWPRFDPGVEDYAMICPSPVTTFDIRAIGHQGRSVRIDGVRTDAQGEVSVGLAVDDVMVISVGTSPVVVGTAPATYRVRCLPSDFPRLRVERPGSPSPGWYLTALTASTPATSFLMILNDRGVPIWYKRSPRTTLNPQLLSTGNIVYDIGEGPFGADPDDVATIIDLDGQVIDTVTTDDPDGFPIDHHELLELPGGGWSTLSYPLRANVDLTALNGPPPSDYPPSSTEPEFGSDEYVADNSIREIDARGDLIWEWTASDHFAIGETQYPVRFNQYRTVAEGGEVDLFHINSMFRVADVTNDYVISARHLDAVARINYPSGDVEWILTSPAEPGRTLPPNPDGAPRLTVVGDPLGGPRRPHDARLVGDVLTLFDNRTDTGQAARAIAYRIDTNAATATLMWQITEPAGRSSGGLGVNRVAADGSVLVDWGGFIQPMFAEFDSNGVLQLSIERVPTGNAYRIVKYPISAFDADVLRVSAGG